MPVVLWFAHREAEGQKPNSCRYDMYVVSRILSQLVCGQYATKCGRPHDKCLLAILNMPGQNVTLPDPSKPWQKTSQSAIRWQDG